MASLCHGCSLCRKRLNTSSQLVDLSTPATNNPNSLEGLGHAATALLTGTKSGVLTTVAWSSDFDSRPVAAGGTLANLAAGMVFWIALRSTRSASVRLRFFLLISLALTPLWALDISSFLVSPISATGRR